MEAGEGIFCLGKVAHQRGHLVAAERIAGFDRRLARGGDREAFQQRLGGGRLPPLGQLSDQVGKQDRKSTRLNSSHITNSYAVFCLKKKTPAPATSRGFAARTCMKATRSCWHA